MALDRASRGVNRVRVAGTFDRKDVGVPFEDNVNRIYQYVFDLEDGAQTLHVEPNDLFGINDILLGIDVYLRLKSGGIVTIQEKILTTSYNTLTIEEYNDPKTKTTGDWFNCVAQYYFVGYGVGNEIQRFVLVDYPALKRAPNLNWLHNKNNGTLASFRYIDFDKIPRDVILAGKWGSTRYAPTGL